MINKYTITVGFVLIFVVAMLMPNTGMFTNPFNSTDFADITPSSDLTEVDVKEVINGDTFIAEFSDGHTEEIKLINIIAPSTGAIIEEGGVEAKEFLTATLNEAEHVYIEYDENDGTSGTHKDYLGRTVAWVYVDIDGELILLQELMVQNGHVEEITSEELKYSALLLEAQK